MSQSQAGICGSAQGVGNIDLRHNVAGEVRQLLCWELGNLSEITKQAVLHLDMRPLFALSLTDNIITESPRLNEFFLFASLRKQ
jgi:hypothetical protein